MIRFDDSAKFRRFTLFIMFGTLAVTALMTITSVLSRSYEYFDDVIYTAIAAVVACGLLLGFGKLLDSEKSRKTGLFIMGLILIEFLLVVLAIWDPARIVRMGVNSQEMLSQAAAVFVPVAVPLALFFHVRQKKGGRISGFVGVAFVLIAMVWFLLAIAYSRYYPVDNNFWGSGWAFWLFSLAVAANVAGTDFGKRYWRWLGLICCVAALGVGTRNIWTDATSSDATNWLTILVTASIVIGHSNILWLCSLKPRQGWLRWAACISAWVSGVLVDIAVITRNTDDLLARIGTAAGICAGCATVGVAILAVFNRRSAPPAGDESFDSAEMSLICPVCHRKENFTLKGGYAEQPCRHCGVVFSVRASAPRCPTCNYLLLMFQGDRCPECGSPIVRAASTEIPLPASAAQG